LKNNWLFIAGIGAGIFIVISFVSLQQISFSKHGPILSPTPENHLPVLLALEPTNASLKSTPTNIPTPLPQITPTVVVDSAKPITTPLALVNEQESEIIGHSVNGSPIEVYRFGSGTHERMTIAGIHGGDEWNTVTLANQLIVYINQNPNVIPDDVTLFVLRNMNPDGEARAHNKYGRVNSNGVDLNRNFPVNWQADWNRAGCWNYLPTTGGSTAGAEPETQSVINFIEKHKIEALISYHSAALGIFPGGNPPDENSIQFAEALAAVSSYPYPPLDTGCQYSGTLADYAASQGIAAVDLELTNHIDTDFATNLKILEILLTFPPQN
jgi:predicted deacylase